MSEIIFEVIEDEIDGGYSASALGYGIHTDGESLEELRQNVKEAVSCYFDETMELPKMVCAQHGHDVNVVKVHYGDFFRAIKLWLPKVNLIVG